MKFESNKRTYWSKKNNLARKFRSTWKIGEFCCYCHNSHFLSPSIHFLPPSYTQNTANASPREILQDLMKSFCPTQSPGVPEFSIWSRCSFSLSKDLFTKRENKIKKPLPLSPSLPLHQHTWEQEQLTRQLNNKKLKNGILFCLATVIKYHRLGGLNKKNSFSHSSGD